MAGSGEKPFLQNLLFSGTLSSLNSSKYRNLKLQNSNSSSNEIKVNQYFQITKLQIFILKSIKIFY